MDVAWQGVPTLPAPPPLSLCLSLFWILHLFLPLFFLLLLAPVPVLSTTSASLLLLLALLVPSLCLHLILPLIMPHLLQLPSAPVSTSACVPPLHSSSASSVTSSASFPNSIPVPACSVILLPPPFHLRFLRQAPFLVLALLFCLIT